MNSTIIDRSLKHIKAYLKSYYGNSVKIEEAPERSNLRLQTKNKYHYFILHFLDEQFVLAISEGHWLPHRCHVDKEHIEKKYQLDCVFYFEKLRTYQKRSLIKNKVNFITYQKDVFIPIIGEILVQRNSHACFRSMSNFRRSGFGLYTDWDKFSSYEQQVFFYIYLHRNRGFRQKEIAQVLQLGRMTVCRILYYFVYMNILEVVTDNKDRRCKIYHVKHPETLFEYVESKGLLQSPIAESFCVRSVPKEIRSDTIELPSFGMTSGKNVLRKKLVVLHEKWSSSFRFKKYNHRYQDNSFVEVFCTKYDLRTLFKNKKLDTFHLDFIKKYSQILNSSP